MHGHWERCPSCERLDGGLEALVPKKGWMDAPGKLAQLSYRLFDFVLCSRENLRCLRVDAGSFKAERERECHEPLLCSVVEIALDTAPLGIGCGDDPAARGSYLRELRTNLCG